MNIQNRAFLIVAGAGALAQILVSVAGTVISALLQPEIAYDPVTGAGSGFDDPFLMASSGLALLLCCLALVLDLGIGAGYAYLHRQSAPLDVQDGMIGGALSGAVARLLSGLVGACISLVMLPFIFSQTAPPGALPGIAAFGLVTGSIGVLFGICIWLVAGLFLGGAGGAAGALVLEPKA